MKIVSYDEADHDDVLALNLQGFDWPLSEDNVKKYLKLDKRWMDRIGVYAVERGRTVGQVITMKVPTKTSEGLEAVGGIAGVTVVPELARTGIAKKLMKATHDLYRENDIRISFLLTSRSLVAYNLYRSLGYFDAMSFPDAQKFVRTFRKPKDLMLRPYRKKDQKLVDQLYSAMVKRLLGFVVRQRGFLNMKINTASLDIERVHVAQANTAEGYVIMSQSEGSISVRDIVCPTQRSFNRILVLIESGAVGKHVFAHVLMPRLLQSRFERRDFKIIEKSWERVMVKPLVRNLMMKKLHELYDFGGRFCMMGPDLF